MKKLKYLLILSLIAILAVGVLIGCQSQYEVDREHTYKITYCANGGRISGKTERYIYLSHSVQDNNGNWKEISPLYAPEPSVQGLINPPTREGYRFVGWAKGKADSDGNPVLLTSENINKHDRTDGGVYLTDDGAVEYDTVKGYREYVKAVENGTYGKDEGELTETARRAKEAKEALYASMHLEYYDYNRDDMWIFKADKVKSDLVLVAVWERYNKFMLVNEKREGVEAAKDDSDKSEDIAELEDEDFVFDVADENYGETYKKYEARIKDVASTNLLTEKNLLENYASFDRNKAYTPIRFYLDAEHTQPLTFPFETTKSLTLIYYTEIKGEYTVVRNNPGDFITALNDNKNIYLEPVDHNAAERVLDLTGSRLSIGSATYSGTIIGNNYTVKGITCEISQSTTDRFNVYGGFFGDLDGATISDLSVEFSFSFEISVDPNRKNAKPADRLCDVNAFAKSMKNTTLRNVKVSAVYTVTRSKVAGDELVIVDGKPDYNEVDNDYDVTVNLVRGWAAQMGFGNSIDADCAISAFEIEG